MQMRILKSKISRWEKRAKVVASFADQRISTVENALSQSTCVFEINRRKPNFKLGRKTSIQFKSRQAIDKSHIRANNPETKIR